MFTDPKLNEKESLVIAQKALELARITASGVESLTTSNKRSDAIEDFYWSLIWASKGVAALLMNVDFRRYTGLISRLGEYASKNDGLGDSFIYALNRMYVLKDQCDIDHLEIEEYEWEEAKTLWSTNYPIIEEKLVKLIEEHSKLISN